MVLVAVAPEIAPLKPMLVTPEIAPAEETSQVLVLIARVFSPPPMVTAPVEVPVLIAVVLLELALTLKAPPEKL